MYRPALCGQRVAAQAKAAAAHGTHAHAAAFVHGYATASAASTAPCRAAAAAAAAIHGASIAHAPPAHHHHQQHALRSVSSTPSRLYHSSSHSRPSVSGDGGGGPSGAPSASSFRPLRSSSAGGVADSFFAENGSAGSTLAALELAAGDAAREGAAIAAAQAAGLTYVPAAAPSSAAPTAMQGHMSAIAMARLRNLMPGDARRSTVGGDALGSALGADASLESRAAAVSQSLAHTSASYAALLSQSMAAATERNGELVLRVVDSWFRAMPSSALSDEERDGVVADVMRHWYIRHGRRMDSRVGEPVEEAGSNVATTSAASGATAAVPGRPSSQLLAPSFGGSGGGGLRMQSSQHGSPPPKDLFRDIILAHQVPLSLPTIKLLAVHAALRRDTQETVATIHFLKHYAKQMLAGASASQRDRQQLEEATRAAATASPSGAVEPIHSGLFLDIAAFNSLLDIFSQHADESGATLLFTELSPAGSPAQEELLFGRLSPDLATYTALVSSFCKNNHVDNALALLEHVRTARAAWLARVDAGEIEVAQPGYTKPPPALDMSIVEVMMTTLVGAGHIQSAVLVLQKLQPPPASPDQQQQQAPTAATNSFGLPPPSLQCFLPLLLDIPRYKEPRGRYGSSAYSHSNTNAFDGMAADEQLMLLAELYGSFRAAGHELPEPKLLLFLERVALMGSGMEVVATANPSTSNVPAGTSAAAAAAATAAADIQGLGERGLQLVSHIQPPRGATPPADLSPFANPQAPVDFALSVLNDRFAPLLALEPGAPLPPHLAGAVPSVSSFNSLLYLFGVVLGRGDFLSHFVALMQRLGLEPNVHTMNILLDSYGRAGVGPNVAYMYEQIKASTASARANATAAGAHAPVAANVHTFNLMLTHLSLAAPSLAASQATAAAAAAAAGSTSASTDVIVSSPLDPLRSLLSDMKALGVAPNQSTWLLLLRQLLSLSGNAEEAQREGMLPPLDTEVALGVAKPLAPHQMGPGDNAPFARPAEEQGAVFELVRMLVECQVAASAAASAASASAPAAGGIGDLFGLNSHGQGSAALPPLLANLPSLSSNGGGNSGGQSSGGAGTVLPPTCLTADVAALYMTAAGKLSDVRSVMQLLEAMKLSASAQVGAASASSAAVPTSALAQVGRALPFSFCRDYFSDRTHLRTQLHYRLTQMDWGNSIALLRIWQALGSGAPAHPSRNAAHAPFPSALSAMSSRGGGSVTGTSGEMTDVDNFAALFRRISDPATLDKVVRECFEQLVWGLDPATGVVAASPLPPSLLPISVRQAAVRNVASALMLHGRFDALLAFIDLLADMATRRDPNAAMGGGSQGAEGASDVAPSSASSVANLVVPFPAHLLPEVFHKALHHSSAMGGGGGLGGGVKVDLRTQLGILSRLVRGGSWHVLVSSHAQAKLDALELCSLVLGEGIERGRSAAELWQVMQLALCVEEPEHNWLAGDRTVQATLRQYVKFPQLLAMADRLLAHWAPMPTAALALQRGASVSGMDPAEEALASERLPYVQLLLQQFVTSADAFAARYTQSVPQPIAPLLDPRGLGGALMYSMAHAATPVVYALWRYAHGMAHPGLAYYNQQGGELLPVPVPLEPEAAARAEKMKLRAGRQVVPLPQTVQEHLLAYCLGHATASSPLVLPSFTAAISSPPNGPTVEYPLAPNPSFGWEVYLQQLLRRTPLSIGVFRSAILMQGCYPPIGSQEETAATTTATTATSESGTAGADATTGSSSSSSPAPMLLGRAQLMRVWRDIQERLLWFEALSLLPHAMGVLVGQRFNPDPLVDLQLKEDTLGLLAGWPAKHAHRALPPIETVQQQLAGYGSAIAAGGGSGASNALVQTSSLAWQRMQPAIQNREEKKLAEVRSIVDATLTACRQKLKQVRMKLFGGAGAGTGTGTGSLSATGAGAASRSRPSASELTPSALSSLSGQPGGFSTFSSAPTGAAALAFLGSPSAQRLIAAYQRMLARVAHPAPLEGDASIQAKIVELFRSPRDFVDFTFYRLRHGSFTDARPAPAASQADTDATPQATVAAAAAAAGSASSSLSTRPSALVFFEFMTKLLAFVASKGLQTTFVNFMRSVEAHPQGLLTLLTPASIHSVAVHQAGAAGAGGAAAAAAASQTTIVQPQDDVAVALLDSILRRRQLPDSNWKTVVELGDEHAAAAAAAAAAPAAALSASAPPLTDADSPVAEVVSSPSASSPLALAADANPLDKLYASHPAWWACQALYWHFRAHQLDTRAFDRDLLFTIKPAGAAPEGGATSAAPASAGGAKLPVRSAGVGGAGSNPFVITPRKVYSWVSHADMAPRELIMLAYESAFQFLVHAVRNERDRGKLAAATAAAATPAAPSASASPAGAQARPRSMAVTSPAAQSLHYYTFQLFKHRYKCHRSEGLAAGRSVRPHKDLAGLEAALQSMLAAPSLSASAEVGLRRAAGLERFHSALELSPAHTIGGSLSSGSRGNSVYDLFHNLSLSHPHALSENVYNMVLASLCIFAHGGLRGQRRAQVEALTAHMTRSLCYRMQAITLGYVVDSCIEQAALDCIIATASGAASPADLAAAESDARALLEFAASLLEEHKHPRGIAFDYGSEKEGMVEPTVTPVFPPPSPCN